MDITGHLSRDHVRCHAQASLGKMFLQNDLSVSARSLKAACELVMLFGDPGMLVTEQCACEVRHIGEIPIPIVCFVELG